MAETSDPALFERGRMILSAMPFYRALNVSITSVEQGAVTLEAPLSPAFEAPPGAFAASSVGVLGDMAAISAIGSALPLGQAASTMDFTVKMLGLSQGTVLRASGTSRQIGKTTCVGAADIYVGNGDQFTLCGTLLATVRRLDLTSLIGRA